MRLGLVLTLAGVLAPAFAEAQCPLGAAKTTGSIRKLALLVGAGHHEARLPALQGTRRDVDAMYRLLSTKFGFPRENICALKEEAATAEAVRRSFKKALIDRAKKNDVIVIYFSALGSQVEDEDEGEDELDGLDESLVLYDSRKEAKGGYVEDLTDDELNGLVRDLYQRTELVHTTVLIDASTSWTLPALEPRAGLKFTTPRDPTMRGPKPERREPDEDDAGMFSPHPGLIVAYAAGNRTQAIEGPADDPGGVFTSALVRVASRASARPLTYQELALSIAPIAGARSRQLATWTGALDTKIFGSDETAALAPKVLAIKKNKVELDDAAFPGIVPGSVLRVRAPEDAASRDPNKSNATIRIQSITGDRAVATIQFQSPDRKINPGDLATLVAPGGDWARLLLYIRRDPDYGGFTTKKRKTLEDELKKFHPSLSARLAFTEDRRYAYELALTTDGRIQLLGPGAETRATFAGDDAEQEVGAALVGLLRQELLLQLEPEPSDALTEHQTIELSMREPPANNRTRDLDDPFPGAWPPSDWNRAQSVPMCRAFQVMRRARAGICGANELELGGLVMSASGELRPLPKTRTTGRDGETRWGAPISLPAPLDSTGFVLGLASCVSSEIPWSKIADVAAYDFEPQSPLAAELAARVDMGPPAINNIPWTWTILPLRAVTPQSTRVAEAKVIESREFSIPRFDIMPYLPDDKEAPLARVLKLAHQLTFACFGKTCDGYDYEQKNAWRGSGCEESDRDAENLKRGIDCSRAVWYVFTRAGLNYGKKTRSTPNCYLSTKLMTITSSASPMREAFVDCMRDPLKRTGDVLVYRHPKEDKGHVVLLIDPERRVVWGSHGFGGSNAGDRGVEYQLVGLKRAFRQFDASERLTACWRHRAFIDKNGAMLTPPRGACLDEPCSRDGFGLPK